MTRKDSVSKISRVKRQIFGLIVLSMIFTYVLHGENRIYTVSTSYNNLLSNEKHDGMLDRIIQETFRRAGLECMIVYRQTDQSLFDVNAGLLDAEINRIAGMEASFPNLLHLTEPNMTMHFVAFAKREFPIDGWRSIRNLNVGVVRGWKILEWHTDGFPKVVYVPTEKELFRMLDLGRLDIALYSKLTGYAALREYKYQNIRHLEPPLESQEMFLYLHSKNSHLIPGLDAALKSMKNDGSYDRIVRETLDRYLGHERSD